MLGRSVAVRQVIGVLLWAVAVAVLFLLLVYPVLPAGWPSLVAQVIAYGLIVVPVVLVRPRRPLPLGATRLALLLGLAVMAAAVVAVALFSHASASAGLAAAVRAVSAGIGEEVVFRGVIFDRLRVVSGAILVQVLLNALLFTAFHIPLVLLQRASLTQLAIVFVFGVVFSTARVVSRGLLLPAAAHIAVDVVW